MNRNNNEGKLFLGTCSWKYDSWRGIVYPETGKINYLKEYSKNYKTVEIDQWFWNFPDPKIVEAYKLSVPEEFRFTLKIPNAISLTHSYKRKGEKKPEQNPDFLSVEKFKEFLSLLNPLKDQLSVLMFQFEYLNKNKMASQIDFQMQLENFAQTFPEQKNLGIEIRNPNYLNSDYFNFLNENDLIPIFIEGYYMPPVYDILRKHIDLMKNKIVIRLHGPDRKKIEELSGRKWNEIIQPKDEELSKIFSVVAELINKGVDVFINVNNHYEGSAPLTIRKIEKLISH